MVVLYQVLAECRLTIRGIVVLYVDIHRLIVAEVVVVVAYGIQPIVVEAAVVVWFLAAWRVSDFFGCFVIFRKYSIFAEEFIKNLFNDKNK